jgi:hypothetical protein
MVFLSADNVGQVDGLNGEERVSEYPIGCSGDGQLRLGFGRPLGYSVRTIE